MRLKRWEHGQFNRNTIIRNMPLFILIINLRYTGLRIHRDQLRIREKSAPQG